MGNEQHCPGCFGVLPGINQAKGYSDPCPGVHVEPLRDEGRQRIANLAARMNPGQFMTLAVEDVRALLAAPPATPAADDAMRRVVEAATACAERGHPVAFHVVNMAQTATAPIGTTTPYCACQQPCGPTRARGIDDAAARPGAAAEGDP